MRQQSHGYRLLRIAWLVATVALVWMTASPSTAHADTEWAERIPPSPSIMWSFVPADMPKICDHIRSMPKGRTYVGTSIPPDQSSRVFLTRVLSSRAPRAFNYGCKSSPMSPPVPEFDLVDASRRVVVMESTILQDQAIDAYQPGTLAIPDVPHVRGVAVRVSYPATDPAALKASFETTCAADEAPRYCMSIARSQVRGSRLEVDLIHSRYNREPVSVAVLEAAGWGVDTTSAALSKTSTSAAQAFVEAPGGLAAYVTADRWLRHRLARLVSDAEGFVETLFDEDSDTEVPYGRRASHRLGFIYERALMNPAEREVHSQTLLATADARALRVDAVQTLTAYGSRLAVEGRGSTPPAQRGSEVAFAGEFALDFGALAGLIRPARWLTEPFEKRPRDAQISMLLSKIDEHSRTFYLSRGTYNPIFHRFTRDRSGPPDETWFTLLFQPMSALAGALQANRAEPADDVPEVGIRGLSVELGLAMYRDVPFDLEVFVNSDAGEQVVRALRAFVHWNEDGEPEYLDRARIAVDSDVTRLAVGEPSESGEDGLVDAELAHISLNFERIKAQFDMMRNTFERSDQLAVLAPYVAAVMCPDPHREYGCLLFDRPVHAGVQRQSGLALYFAIAERRNMALSVTADARTRVVRFAYGDHEVEPPAVPESDVEPVAADSSDLCVRDATWAAADLMSRDILGMYELVHVLDMGGGRRVQFGRQLNRQLVEFSVEDMEKAQAKYLRKRRDALVGELETIAKRCEQPDSPATKKVREAVEFWKDWTPLHERVGYQEK